jgi:hypothetical protein
VVGLQPRPYHTNTTTNSVYSKKWSVCNDHDPPIRPPRNSVYSKKWSVCNNNQPYDRPIRIQFTRKSGRSATIKRPIRPTTNSVYSKKWSVCNWSYWLVVVVWIQFTRKSGRSATTNIRPPPRPIFSLLEKVVGLQPRKI